MNNILLGKRDFARRFRTKVEVTGADECWNWKAARQSKGYGSFGTELGRTELAHRIAYRLQVGEIPEGLLVMHSCDNRLCCNPKHLRLGTIADNNYDAYLKGRVARGEKSGRAKLKEKQVTQIRQDYRIGKHSIPQLASMYRVSGTNIRSIVNNRHWKMPLAG